VKSRALLGAIAALLLTALAAAQERQPHGRRFLPQDLGLLEGPDREAWQKPEEVMDAVGVADGTHVADLGAGGGWFTVRLARRVGPNGMVYAEDIQREMIAAIERRVQSQGLRNVRTILGTEDDPRLAAGSVDAALIVDSYHEMRAPVPLLRRVAAALRPGGKLGIIDFKKTGGGPGPPLSERVDPEVVIADARSAGLVLIEQRNALPYQYLLTFSPAPRAPSAVRKVRR
jgi:ubiquinone/menaquinone biosynthesis C-methylase UbiE